MADKERVEEILSLLNKEDGPGKGSWNEVAGFHALKPIRLKDGSLVEIKNATMPIKTFWNSKTGEMRMFSAQHFDKAVSAVPDHEDQAE